MGRRTRIPSQKALMAKENANKGYTKGKKSKQSGKVVQGDTGSKNEIAELEEGEINGTVVPRISKIAEVKKIHQDAITTWKEGVLNAQHSAGSSTKRSWFDEVEQDLTNKEVKESIWKKFDINKISNAGFKSESVPPDIQESISDHCPILVSYMEERKSNRKSFQFYNVWAKHPNFMDKVRHGWEAHVNVHIMFKVVRRLKLLKKTLKDLNNQFFRNIVDSQMQIERL
ncbi:hypothetical protein HAX54_041701 [Datura stramonium]|uniref:Uncharacterized protein n=1 Tax=Datura stramonium TaxID=4076 RepID=A0ABS8W0J2_DATST|nr:hypothetical protein [Datura stramonium]